MTIIKITYRDMIIIKPGTVGGRDNTIEDTVVEHNAGKPT